jgi:hypothetical protein
MSKKERKEQVFFNDAPVLSNEITTKDFKSKIKDQDMLGLQDYAKALYEFINVCETPMTIGVQGDWGIGKTSLLNMIKGYLEGGKGPKYGIIWFNTWHYSLFGQEEYLGIAVIKGILDQMKLQFNIKDPENKFKTVVDKLTNVAKNMRFNLGPLSVSAADAALLNDSIDSRIEYEDISTVMLNFRDSFRELVELIIRDNKISKLVFFVDDIDRVKPVKALELLESLKNFMDVEYCVFLLAVDYEVVQIGMADKLGQDLQKLSGKSFFDKIIQLPFTMPSNSYDLGKYIKTLLQEAEFLNNIKDDDIEFYEDVTICTVVRNPRSIKRIINYARLIKLIYREMKKGQGKFPDSYNKVLYTIICMQVAWPEIFAYFVNNPTPTTIKNIEDWDFLEKIPFIEKLYYRTPNRDMLRSNISAYFDLLYDLLDENKDGYITMKELEPVHIILKNAKLTTVKDFQRPIDTFFHNADKNYSNKSLSKFQMIFKKMPWVISGKIDYRISSSQYATIIFNRKQIGSLVTLKKFPLIFRLDCDSNKIIEFLTPFHEENSNFTLNKVVKSVESASLRGFGETLIDLKELSEFDEVTIQRFLQKLYDFVLSYFSKERNH